MDSDRHGQPDDPDVMAAVTELGDALREPVDASVRTTVPVPELRAAAAEARATTARLARGRRSPTQRDDVHADYSGAITDASGRHAPTGRP